MPKGVYKRSSEHLKKLRDNCKKLHESRCAFTEEANKKRIESCKGINKGRKRPDIKGDKNPMRNPEIAAKISGENHHMKRPEWRQWMKDNNPMKIKEYKDKISNENCHLWKGGTYWYLHKKAKELFGKNKCQLCEMSNEQHIETYNKSLHMHCEHPKYKLIKEYWFTLCNKCHCIVEEGGCRKIHE